MEIHVVEESIYLDHSLEGATMIVNYCHETANKYQNADSRDDSVRAEVSNNITTPTDDPNQTTS